MRRCLPVVALILLAYAGTARADGPLTFRTVRLPLADGSGTEPRITVAPNDVRYAITSADRNGATVVMKSIDQGQTWQRTADPVTHEVPTIDVDVVAMNTGRILASELDEEGLNFPSSISDDQGKTWTETRGATELADEDRQWFAVDKDRDGDGKPTVYLLYHNLGSGVASHNMYVSRSDDGGATFGAPIPTTLPGSQAYLDLQCADSGGPSSIAINPATGRLYVTFTTRASPTLIPGQDLGGCSAMPLEFNIVNATRVWVATSPDDTPGSWAQSLAVDDSASGQIVSMQLAYGSLDNRGGMYVAYPESPQPYPNMAGAAVKLVWQDPARDGTLADAKWSKPVTLVPATDPNTHGGANLVHLAVGDPGKVAVAYYKGIPAGDSANWYTHVVHSLNVRSANPTVVDQEVSPVPTHHWDASAMMGICGTPSPVQGVENGLACDRSTDVWGITEDQQCDVIIDWPTAGKSQDGTTANVAGNAPGTYVSTQAGGSRLCGADGPGSPNAGPFLPPPGVEGAPPGSGGLSQNGGCVDRLAPVSRTRGHVGVTKKSLSVHGVSTDLSCKNGKAGVKVPAALRYVRVSIGRRLADKRCRFMRGDGTFGPEADCTRTSYLSASGRTSWSLNVKLKKPLPRGRYVVWVRGVDVFLNVERKLRTRNLARFTVR